MAVKAIVLDVRSSGYVVVGSETQSDQWLSTIGNRWTAHGKHEERLYRNAYKKLVAEIVSKHMEPKAQAEQK